MEKDISDRLSGATLLSTLDLKDGYDQIQMHLMDQHKTLFTFERKHFDLQGCHLGMDGRNGG